MTRLCGGGKYLHRGHNPLPYAGMASLYRDYGDAVILHAYDDWADTRFGPATPRWPARSTLRPAGSARTSWARAAVSYRSRHKVRSYSGRCGLPHQGLNVGLVQRAGVIRDASADTPSRVARDPPLGTPQEAAGPNASNRALNRRVRRVAQRSASQAPIRSTVASSSRLPIIVAAPGWPAMRAAR
jgi:hypothetical protein